VVPVAAVMRGQEPVRLHGPLPGIFFRFAPGANLSGIFVPYDVSITRDIMATYDDGALTRPSLPDCAAERRMALATPPSGS